MPHPEVVERAHAVDASVWWTVRDVRWIRPIGRGTPPARWGLPTRPGVDLLASFTGAGVNGCVEARRNELRYRRPVTEDVTAPTGVCER
jgi:hypothetical protein